MNAKSLTTTKCVRVAKGVYRTADGRYELIRLLSGRWGLYEILNDTLHFIQEYDSKLDAIVYGVDLLALTDAA